MFWADTILLFAGLLVIGLALLLSQRLGNRPVELGFDKLGLDLKAAAVLEPSFMKPQTPATTVELLN